MKTKLLNYFFGLSAIMFVTSCASYDNQQAQIDKAAAALSKVEDSTDAWGKIAVSELNLIENTGQFKSSFDLDVSNYVASAQNSVNGAASGDVESGFYLGVAAQASVAPPVNLSAPASGGNPLSSNPIPNNASTALNNLAASNPVLNIRNLTPTADLGQSVRKGLNDKIAEQLLKLMANPPTNSEQKVVWAVMQVTCQPQRLTKSGYMGEFNATLKYARIVTNQSSALIAGIFTGDTNSEPQYRTNTAIALAKIGAENILEHPDPGNSSAKSGNDHQPAIGWFDSNEKYQINYSDSPSILAVLPMVDSQMQELRHSDRNVLELATALSAAFSAKGLTGSAQILSDYVKQQQDDVDTRTAMPMVTAFTDGASFGVQIYPALQALKNPGKPKSSPAQILQPVSFPVVVALLVDKQSYGSGTNIWDQLWTQVRSRWIPMSGGPSYTLQEQLARARNLDDAVENIDTLLATNNYGNGKYWNQLIELMAARDSIQSSAISYCDIRPLPELFPAQPKKDTTPKLSAVSPHIIWRDRPTTFTVQVDNMTQVSQVGIAGILGTPLLTIPLTAFTTNITKTTNLVADVKTSPLVFTTNIVAITNVATVTNGVLLTCRLDSDVFSSTMETTNNLEFTVFDADNGKMASTNIPMTILGARNNATVQISRDANGKFTGISVNVSKTVSEQTLIDTAREILKTSEAPPTTQVIK